MILHLEIRGWALHIELGKSGPAATAPDNAPQPMQVYAEESTDPVSHRLGFTGRSQQSCSGGD